MQKDVGYYDIKKDYVRMNKKGIFCVLILGLILGCLVIEVKPFMNKMYMNKRKIGNLDAIYTYYERILSVRDFEQFDYNTTYEDMVMCLGEPNGWVGSGVMWPYYELEDNRFAVCHCIKGGKMAQISIYNQKNFEYKLLPLKLPEKSNELKDKQIKEAQKLEMNEILWIIGIKNWTHHLNQPAEWDEPMGEYSLENLKQYTNREITADITYYFGKYEEEYAYPLFQIIQLYEGTALLYFGYEIWDTDLNQEEKYLLMEKDDWLYAEGGGFLNGGEKIWVMDLPNTDFSDIDLSQEKFANSMALFLINHVESLREKGLKMKFWGSDKEGNYMCLFFADSKQGWRKDYEEAVYYITVKTENQEVSSVSIKLLSDMIFSEGDELQRMMGNNNEGTIRK